MNYLNRSLAGLFGAALATVAVTGVAAAAKLELAPPGVVIQSPGAAELDSPSAKPRTFGCAPTKLNAKTDEDVIATVLSEFAPMPDTKIKFKTKTKGCVIVRFTAAATAGPGHVVVVAAVLDGAEAGSPESMAFAGDAAEFLTSHSAEFLFKNVAPGKHTIEMYWGVAGEDDPMGYVATRTTVVQY